MDDSETKRGKPGPESQDLVRFLTREELAQALKISLRTVDVMMAAREIPYLCLRGTLVRFYLPDVVRHLTATALTSKRRCAHRSDTEETSR